MSQRGALCGASRPSTITVAVIGVALCAGHLGRAADPGTGPGTAGCGGGGDAALFEEPDSMALLQRPLPQGARPRGGGPATPPPRPHLVGLRRERVPVYREGRAASFKTAYSGVLRAGAPPQEFRVVFDTGSGHVVLPASECASEACLAHRRYDSRASRTSVPINANGSVVPEGGLCDQVTIGFGTGEVTGEFTLDRVCLGASASNAGGGTADNDGSPDSAGLDPTELCVDMHMVVAVDMSLQPFKTFQFDGIVGLGLSSLSLTSKFSALHMLFSSGKLDAASFGVFLAEDTFGEASEIALGGYNSDRLLEALSWTPVTMPGLGYWLIDIVTIRIDGRALDVCDDGSCRGIVDTGSSHLGVPAPYDSQMADLLTQPAGDLLDCLLVAAPVIQIELVGYNITLHPSSYMRPLPLGGDVRVDPTGVDLLSNQSNTTPGSGPVADSPAEASRRSPSSAARLATPSGAAAAIQQGGAPQLCRPKLMPVRMAKPLGPKLFILGEPLFHRYYTVFDWGRQQVGFGLANNRRNTMGLAMGGGTRSAEAKEVVLLQTTRSALSARASPKSPLQGRRHPGARPRGGRPTPPRPRSDRAHESGSPPRQHP